MTVLVASTVVQLDRSVETTEVGSVSDGSSGSQSVAVPTTEPLVVPTTAPVPMPPSGPVGVGSGEVGALPQPSDPLAGLRPGDAEAVEDLFGFDPGADSGSGLPQVSGATAGDSGSGATGTPDVGTLAVPTVPSAGSTPGAGSAPDVPDVSPDGLEPASVLDDATGTEQTDVAGVSQYEPLESQGEVLWQPAPVQVDTSGYDWSDDEVEESASVGEPVDIASELLVEGDPVEVMTIQEIFLDGPGSVPGAVPFAAQDDGLGWVGQAGSMRVRVPIALAGASDITAEGETTTADGDADAGGSEVGPTPEPTPTPVPTAAEDGAGVDPMSRVPSGEKETVKSPLLRIDAVDAGAVSFFAFQDPTPTPTVEPTATPEPTPTPTADPAVTPTPEPTPTPDPAVTATPVPTATADPAVTVTPVPTPTPTADPAVTATPEPTPTTDPGATATPEPTPTTDPGATPTPTPEPTATPTVEVLEDEVEVPWRDEPGVLWGVGAIASLQIGGQFVDVVVPDAVPGVGAVLAPQWTQPEPPADGDGGSGAGGDVPVAVEFAQVLTGVDAQVAVTAAGAKTLYRLGSAEAGAELFEAVRLPDGWVAVDAGGSVMVVDGDGVARLLWEGGPVWDASGAESVATLELFGQSAGVAVARVVLDQGWLASPDRVFPVVVDPVHSDPEVVTPTTTTSAPGLNGAVSIEVWDDTGVVGSGASPALSGTTPITLEVDLDPDDYWVCAVYKVLPQDSSGGWPPIPDPASSWRFIGRNCGRGNFHAYIGADASLDPGRYRVYWTAVQIQKASNQVDHVAYGVGAPIVWANFDVVAGGAPAANGPTSVLGDATSVTLFAQPDFPGVIAGSDAYQWAFVNSSNGSIKHCDQHVVDTTADPWTTIDLPTNGDRFTWCVRAKISGAGSTVRMPFSPWRRVSLTRSDAELAQLFGDGSGVDGRVLVQGVNPASGNYFFDRREVRISGAVGAISLTRSYNSQNEAAGAFGVGWSSLLDSRLETIRAGTPVVVWDIAGVGVRYRYTDWLRLHHADGSTDDFLSRYERTHFEDGGWSSREAISIDSLAGAEGLVLTLNAAGRYVLSNKAEDRLIYEPENGRIIGAERAGGLAVDLVYDANGNVERIVDDETDREIRLAWSSWTDANGEVVWRVTEAAHVTTRLGGTSGFVYPDDYAVWSFSYAESGLRLTKVCDPRPPSGGNRYCEKYGWKDMQINRMYAPSDDIGDQNQRLYYDAEGRVERVRSYPHGDLSLFDDTLFAYSASAFTPNLITTVTDAKSAVWFYQFDQNGQLILLDKPDTAAGSGIWTWTWQNQQLVAATTPFGDPGLGDDIVAPVEYDEFGRPIKRTSGGGLFTRYDYSGTTWRLVAECSNLAPAGTWTGEHCVRYDYYSSGQLFKRTYTAPNDAVVTEEWFYNADGQLARTVDAAGRETTFDYYTSTTADGRDGDLRYVTTPAGLVREFRYDQAGNVRYTYEGPTGTTRLLVNQVNYHNDMNVPFIEYGPRITNPISGIEHRHVMKYSYTENRWLKRTQEWDAHDKPATLRQTDYHYDRIGREIRSQAPAYLDATGATVRPEISRVYDANGNVETVCDARNICATTIYDARNQPTSTTQGTDLVSTMTYTDAGQVERFQEGTAGRETFTHYNRDGDVTRVRERHLTADPTWHIATYVVFEPGTRWVKTEYSGGTWPGNAADYITNHAERVIDYADFTPDGRAKSIREYLPGADRWTAITFEPDGQIDWQQVTRDGNTSRTDYAYDSAGRPITVTVDATGLALTTTSVFDAWSNPIRVTDPAGNESFFTYDIANRLVTTESPIADIYSGHNSTPTSAFAVSTIGYDAFGNVTHEQDPTGDLWVTTYDPHDRISIVTHPELIQPDPNNPGSTITLSGASEQFWYDPNGNLAKNIDRDAAAVTTYTYDDFNRVQTATDPTGGVSQFFYDIAGNLVTSIDPIGGQQSFTYDRFNNVLTETTTVAAFTFTTGEEEPLRNETWTYTYDTLGYLDTATSPLGHQSNYDHDPAGRLLSTTDADGYTTSSERDYADRLISQTGPDGSVAEMIYDNAGRLLVERTIGPDGTQTSQITTTYDLNNNPLTVTSAEGVHTAYTYNARNQLETATIGTGNDTAVSSFGYDLEGNLALLTDGNGNTTTYLTNSWGLQTEIREPATTAHPNVADRTFTSVYDSRGLEAARLEPGNTVTVTHDPAGRMLREAGNDGAWREYDYDLAGRMTAARSYQVADINFFYDTAGRLKETTGPTSRSIALYDFDGRPVSRTDFAAAAHTYTWTPAGRLQQHADGVSGVTSTYVRDSAGRLVRVDHTPNSGGAVFANREFTYRPDGRLDNDNYRDGNSLAWQRSYLYDNDSQIVRETRLLDQGRSRVHYNYDTAGRLTNYNIENQVGGAWPGPQTLTTYNYDNAGNRTTTTTNSVTETWVYDERNRLTTEPAGNRTWTARGAPNTAIVDGTVTSFGYNSLGQQTSVGGLNYTYDGLNRLRTRTDTSVDQTTFFSYSGTQPDPVRERTQDNTTSTTLHRTTYGRTPAGNLASQNNTAATSTPTGPQLVGIDRYNDTAYLADPTSGAIALTTTYNPFGEPDPTTNNQPAPTLGFQTDWTDPTTGDINMHARWYTPSSATFRTRDTYPGQTQTPISLNRYTYATNNPIKYWDPTGRCVEICNGRLGGANSVPYVYLRHQNAVTGQFRAPTSSGREIVGLLDNLQAGSRNEDVDGDYYLFAGDTSNIVVWNGGVVTIPHHDSDIFGIDAIDAPLHVLGTAIDGAVTAVRSPKEAALGAAKSSTCDSPTTLVCTPNRLGASEVTDEASELYGDYGKDGIAGGVAAIALKELLRRYGLALRRGSDRDTPDTWRETRDDYGNWGSDTLDDRIRAEFSSFPTIEAYDLRLLPTEYVNRKSRYVDRLRSNMEENGWSGPPVELFEHDGSLYIINGHHRARAARQAGLPMPYKVLTEAELLEYGWNSPEDLFAAHADTWIHTD